MIHIYKVTEVVCDSCGKCLRFDGETMVEILKACKECGWSIKKRKQTDRYTVLCNLCVDKWEKQK